MYFRPPKIKLPKFTIRPKLPVRPPVPNPPKPTLPLESMKAAGDHALKELGEKIVEHYKEHEEHKEHNADKEL